MYRGPRPTYEKECWRQVWDSVINAKPEDLLMSRMNTHCFGMDSIVVKNTNGQLDRVWLHWPEAKLYKNVVHSPTLELSIHNHRYDIRITGVCGKVYEHEYDAPARTFNTHYQYKHYTFDSPLTGGKGPEYKGVRELRHVRSYLLAGATFGNQSAYLDYSQLHTLEVPVNTYACWTVNEGPKVRDWTDMYTDLNGDFALEEGLYKPFSSYQAVIDRVARFEREADLNW